MDLNIISNSAQETIDIGRRIGSQMKGGEVVCLVGPLGSGKTHLIKGIAIGSGAEDTGKSVNSPTFVIINEYKGKYDIYHIDCYRLESVAEFEMLGFDDYCYPESVVLIEWADKVEKALRDMEVVRIELSHEGQHSRGIEIKNKPIYMKIVDRQ
ncbi:MAG: tRNA (adenosine(37)-N6)-threonylcarbamoyltransferase complex ATPase subunit type 1 TsaE [Planctomycetota bacterium]|jgi:tRNA threonylcarbamoyladenosine biosynthesis protein TsaE